MRIAKIVALALVTLVGASAIRVLAYDSMPPPSPMAHMFLWALLFFPSYRFLGLHREQKDADLEDEASQIGDG